MTSTALRLGLVGCGNIARRHAAALRGIREATLVAVSDIDGERARRFALEHDSPAVVDPDELASHADVDAVVLCVPADRHAELGVSFAEAGKHVLSEKPIDTDATRALALIHSAARYGVALSVVSQHRFHPDVLWLRKRVSVENPCKSAWLAMPAYRKVCERCANLETHVCVCHAATRSGRLGRAPRLRGRGEWHCPAADSGDSIRI